MYPTHQVPMCDTQHPMYQDHANTNVFAGIGYGGPFVYEPGPFFGPGLEPGARQPLFGPAYGPEPGFIPGYGPGFGPGFAPGYGYGAPFIPEFGIGPGFF